MKVWRCAAAVLSLAVPVVVTSGMGTASTPPTDPPTLPATASAPPSESTWERVVPGGDCACADGSEFNFWVREADPARVVLYLEGGGACFDGTSCAFTDSPSTLYDWNISPDDDPAQRGGIFDFDGPANPFAAYSVVYVPYCTGDVHLGHITREYSPELTVEHVGAVNGMAALGYLAEHFGDAEEVVVVGESAGAIASPVYAGHVSDLVPDAQVTVFADGSGAYPDDPDQAAGIGALWGSSRTIPAWEVNEGLTPADWSIPRFWVQAGLHDPEIVMSRFDYAYDRVQGAFMEVTGADTSDVGASMAANEAMVEEVGIVQLSYTAPGDEHTISTRSEFYDMEVGGVRLVDWLRDVVAGVDVADVRCDECGGPATASTG
jgi:hypothetical protein